MPDFAHKLAFVPSLLHTRHSPGASTAGDADRLVFLFGCGLTPQSLLVLHRPTFLLLMETSIDSVSFPFELSGFFGSMCLTRSTVLAFQPAFFLSASV